MTAQQKSALETLAKMAGLILAVVAVLSIFSNVGIDLLGLAKQADVDLLNARVDVIESNQRVEAHKTERILCIVEALAEERPTPPGCIR